MCGRYDLVVNGWILAGRFGVLPDELSAGPKDWQPRYNIAPGQMNPVVVRAGDRGKRLVSMKWGLVPSWATEPKTGFATINARAETVAQKPTFRKALVSRRCLVPATGYFEWSQAEGKQPYRVRVRAGADSDGGAVVALAGLYDVWRGHGGEELLSYTIVTTQASSDLRGLHERMPVILPREAEEVWLDPSAKDVEELVGLLRPSPEGTMKAYRVGRGVNRPANDLPAIILPI